MADDVVLYEVADGVATVTLNRPEARNALSRALLKALNEALRQADADDDVAAIVLTGTDPAFSAGVDLKELGSELRVPGIQVVGPVEGDGGDAAGHVVEDGLVGHGRTVLT